MLLLMIDAKLNERKRRGWKLCKQSFERFVDMDAIRAHLIERRATEHSSVVTSVPSAFGFVITVEQEREALIERAIARHVIAQDERLEEPACVREMPLRG